MAKLSELNPNQPGICLYFDSQNYTDDIIADCDRFDFDYMISGFGYITVSNVEQHEKGLAYIKFKYSDDLYMIEYFDGT